MSVSSYTNKAVNGVIGGTNLDGASNAVGRSKFDEVSGGTGDILGKFTSSTSEKHCTITLSSCGIGDGIKNDQIDRSGINRLNDPKPPVGNIDKEMNAGKTSGIQYKTYPPDLTFSSYWMELQFGEYVRPYFGGKDKTTPTRFNPSYIVNLPLPPQLSDAQSLGWQNTNFGLTGLAMESFDQIRNQKAPDTYSIKDIGNKFNSFGAGVGEAAAYAAVSLANRDIQYKNIPLGVNLAAAMGNIYGYALNPYPGAYYVGPELRAFQFSWIFVPESQKEMRLIKGITSEIRRRTLSTPTGQLGAFLKYPEICRIKLHPDTLSKAFPIRECALTGINIDYAPYGLSFHTDKNPTAIGLGLVFGEIKPLFTTDFEIQEDVEMTSDEFKEAFTNLSDPDKDYTINGRIINNSSEIYNGFPRG
jgi:hypothetical protein